jgi:hypothetical protein
MARVAPEAEARVWPNLGVRENGPVVVAAAVSPYIPREDAAALAASARSEAVSAARAAFWIPTKEMRYRRAAVTGDPL